MRTAEKVDIRRICGVNIYKEVTYMANYREILRLHRSLGVSKTRPQQSANVLGT